MFHVLNTDIYICSNILNIMIIKIHNFQIYEYLLKKANLVRLKNNFLKKMSRITVNDSKTHRFNILN